MAPTPTQIHQFFHPLSIQGSQSQFFNHVADNVEWTIQGKSPMSKTFTTKQDFADATLTVLREKVLSEPLRLRVVNVVGGGQGTEWATVELEAVDAVCKNGLTYDMKYCWVCRFGSDDKIVQVRAYLCTKLLTDAMNQNM